MKVMLNSFHCQNECAYFHANQTNFHMKGFSRVLALKQEHNVILKSPAVLFAIGLVNIIFH